MCKSESGWFPNNTDAGKDLIQQVLDNGDKITPTNVIGIMKQPDGKIIWLETGNVKTGLQHILLRHANQFIQHGIPEDKIGIFVLNAVAQNKIVGYQGKREPRRAVYKYEYGGKNYYLAVSVSSNGYIIGANPKSGDYEK